MFPRYRTERSGGVVRALKGQGCGGVSVSLEPFLIKGLRKTPSATQHMGAFPEPRLTIFLKDLFSESTSLYPLDYPLETAMNLNDWIN